MLKYCMSISSLEDFKQQRQSTYCHWERKITQDLSTDTREMGNGYWKWENPCRDLEEEQILEKNIYKLHLLYILKYKLRRKIQSSVVQWFYAAQPSAHSFTKHLKLNSSTGPFTTHYIILMSVIMNCPCLRQWVTKWVLTSSTDTGRTIRLQEREEKGVNSQKYQTSHHSERIYRVWS